MNDSTINHNEFFKQIAIRICSSLDIDKALKACFIYIKKLLPISWIHLNMLDLEQNIIQFVATVQDEDEKDFGEFFLLPDELKGDWIREKHFGDKIKVENNPASDPKFSKALKDTGISLNTSFMTMRLELEGNRIGTLNLKANGTNIFNEEHQKLCLSVHDPIAIATANALKHQEVTKLKDLLADDNRYLHRELHEISGSEIIGIDFGLKDVMKMVQQVSSLESPVILLGETGVGKSLIASTIHYSSQRKNGPFIKVNCGAIPPSLVDSELFGHEKGSFTGAISQKRGRFERADKGTIFLDEIGELPLEAQVRLLHVIQNKEIERVGGTKPIPVDIRVISATNRDLKDMIKNQLFREDLWFRLNVFPITIPPLRQRKDDIPALVHHFIEQKAKDLKLHIIPALKKNAMSKILNYNWQGNIRELENVIERALIQNQEGILSFDHLEPHPESRINGTEKPTENIKNGNILKMDEVIANHIKQTLAQTGGKISGKNGAAEFLGMHPNTLRKRMEKLNIPFKKKDIK